MQDQTLRYDAFNRLTDISSVIPGADYQIHYTYDGNGNRLSESTSFTNDNQENKRIVVNYQYDTMNRQVKVSGAITTSGAGASASTSSSALVNSRLPLDDGGGTEPPLDPNADKITSVTAHTITYDWLGNRTSDTAVDRGATSVENYRYDTLGRLSRITDNSGNLIGERHYDSSGRVVYSLDKNNEKHYSDYDVLGRLKHQDTYINGTYHHTVNYADYDRYGDLYGYTVNTAGGSQQTEFRYEPGRDGYQQVWTIVTNIIGNKDARTTKQEYDGNGNLMALAEYDQVGGTRGKVTAYVSDSDGHVLEKKQDGLVTHSLIANGQLVGSSNANYESFSSGYTPASSPAATNAPSVYVVQKAGETLLDLAKAIYGDQALWYIIADANGGISSELTVGQQVVIPSRVNTITNSYQTFKPYDKANAVGPTTPELAMPAPQSGGGGGCGGLGKLIMVAVAVAATIYTAGAFTAGGMSFANGLGVFLGTSGLTTASAIGAGAAAGAVGSLASQAVGNAIGAQDGFNWKGVALSAISGAASAGVGAVANTLTDTALLGAGDSLKFSQIAARAVVSNVASQSIGLVTGMQEGFQWRNTAASFGAAYVGTLAGSALQNSEFASAFGSAKDFAVRSISGMAAGATASILSGGRMNVAQIATDAFGNALGSSLAANSSGTPDLSADDWDKIKQSNLSGPRLAAGFGGEPNSQSDVATLGDMTYASARAAERSAYVATVIGADIVDGIPSVTVPRPGPSWLQRNILTPAGQLISQVGDVLSDAGQGFLSWANDTFVKPSGSTDEMPQYFQYSRPSVSDVEATQRAVNSYRPYYPSGPAFVAVDPAREASARAQAQRNGNNLAMAFGGYFVAAPMLAARQFGLNETQVGEAGMLGLSLQELAGTRGGGPRPPAFTIPGGARTTLVNGTPRTISTTVGRNTATWTVDESGSPISVTGKLQESFSGVPRSAAEIRAQANAAASGVNGDQGGHLIGHRFVLNQGQMNLFPQEGNFNMSAFKVLENDYARYTARGYQVDFAHTLGDFDPITGRPGSVSVKFEVNDANGNLIDTFADKFLNQPGQTYKRRAF